MDRLDLLIDSLTDSEIFQQKVLQIVKKEVDREKLTEAPPLMTREEVSRLLKICMVTLDKYTDSGFITAHRIGRRILYNPLEVEKALTALSERKHKRQKKAS